MLRARVRPAKRGDLASQRGDPVITCPHLKKLGGWCHLATNTKCAVLHGDACPIYPERFPARAFESSDTPPTRDAPTTQRERSLAHGEVIATQLQRPVSSEPAPLELPPEIEALVEVTRLKHPPALVERRLEAMRTADPETRARALEALETLEGYAALAQSIRAEVEAIADVWLHEVERFVLGKSKTKIVRAIAVMMLEARLWSYGAAEHFFCSQADLAAIAGVSLRSVQRHLSPKDPRAAILHRWLSRRTLYASRSTGECSRVGTVYRFRLEPMELQNLEPCPQPRLEALVAPWRSADELPLARGVLEDMNAEARGRWTANGTLVPDSSRQKTAGNITFPNNTERRSVQSEIRIEGVHLEGFAHSALKSYTRQSRLERQATQNAAREDAARAPRARLDAARLEAALIAEQHGSATSAFATASRRVEHLETDLALATLAMPRLGAFKRQDDALEGKARAVAQRLGDALENVPFWKSVFKAAGSDSRVFAAVSETLEAARNNRVRETLPKYCVGVLKRAKVIQGAAQTQLLEVPRLEVDTTDVRLSR
jgi:hypothetical protein